MRDSSTSAPALLRWAGARIGPVEARRLLTEICQVQSLVLASPTRAQRRRFQVSVEQRLAGFPLQYLLGSAAFRDFEVKVGPGVLVPRPETEMLVEYALEARTGERAVDLCSGSGVVALALARAGMQVDAVELSEEAARYASANLEGSGVRLHIGDALAWAGGPYDLVVANPPYVAQPVKGDVLFEPDMALYGGGEDGASFPRQLVERARFLLVEGGVLIMEHSEEQAESLVRFALDQAGFEAAVTLPDLAGRPRFLRATA